MVETSVTQTSIFSLIEVVSGQSNILTIPRIFIEATGDIESALFLSQLLYWTGRSTRPDGYIYKTYREWQEEIGLTQHQVSRATNKLKSFGILETVLKKANGSPTVHYRIITDTFSNWIMQFLVNGLLKNAKSIIKKVHNPITEITTEITTINDDDGNPPEIEKIYVQLKDDFNQDTTTTREMVAEYIDKYGPADTLKAMEKAIGQNCLKLAYVKAILENGVDTPKEKKTPADSRTDGDTWPVR